MYNPLINVLVRTSNRPNFFTQCYKSVREQTHKNIRLIVSYDDKATQDYLKEYSIDALVGFKRIEDLTKLPNQSFHPSYIEKPFPANLYFNKMMECALPGYIVMLDDDNCFTSPESLVKIASHITSENQMLLWRVKFPSYLVPDNNHFRQIPTCCQIDTAGFSFHTNYTQHAVWDAYNYCDYRTAHNLFLHIPQKVFVNEVLTRIHAVTGKGLRRDYSTKTPLNHEI